MKKILILGDANSSHTQKWASGLDSVGYDVVLFSLSKPKNEVFDSKNVRLAFALNSIAASKLYRNGENSSSFFTALKLLKAFIKEYNPDIVHSHYASSYGLLGALTGFKPFIISVWGSDVFEFPKRSWLHRQILKYNFKRADKIVTSSDVMRNEITQYTSTEVRLIPFGIDTSVYKKTKAIDGMSNVITIGLVKSMEKYYGIDYLIDAFEIIRKKYPSRELKLILAGSGSELENYKHTVESKGLSQHVFFKGKIEQKKVADCLNEIDIFVNPSIHESFGVSVLEASSCELSVIASNVGGLPEVVEDKQTGLLVKVADSAAIADAISFFIDNPEQMNKFGTNGRSFVQEKYEWTKQLEKIDSLYHSILKTKN